MAERITQRQFYIWHISKCLKWHTNSLAYDWKTSKLDLNPSVVIIHVLENRYRLFAVQRSVTILDTQWCKMLNILFMTYPCPVASPPSSLPHHTWDHSQWDLFYSEIWQVLCGCLHCRTEGGAELSNAVQAEWHHSNTANLQVNLILFWQLEHVIG